MQGLPGERERLRSALLTDQDGILTATRRRLARLAQARGIELSSIDDVVQETLLEAWSHLERLHSPAGFQPWIDEICRNICRRAVRRRKMDLLRHIPQCSENAEQEDTGDLLESFPSATDTDPFEAFSRQDLVVLLDRALSMVSPATRQMIEMCYLLELPHTTVAERLGITNGALDVRLHRVRRQLLQIFHGPLRTEAEALGLTLDSALAEGWQATRLWCPLCTRHRLEGCFLRPEAQNGPNLHLRCPQCSRIYRQDTVHSMGLVNLTGLHSFRPAWKRAMQGIAERLIQALPQGHYPCLGCGKPALLRVEGHDTAAVDAGGSPTNPYPFWFHVRCIHCGTEIGARGDVPSIDQLVYWSHPRTRQFLQHSPHWRSMPGKAVEYAGQPALHFQISDLESSNHLTVLAHRHTLLILSISSQ
jgi:RNA polymerase sigma factor (sigma-70 family)